MKERIRLIMEQSQLTPSAFAEKLGLGRAVISHLLNGRNNPSLDVVTRILSKFENINPEWLLSGKGNMYRDKNSESIPTISKTNISEAKVKEPDLFSDNPKFEHQIKMQSEYDKENLVNSERKISESELNQKVIYQKMAERKVNKIIVYYSDNTFEIFETNNKAL